MQKSIVDIKDKQRSRRRNITVAGNITTFLQRNDVTRRRHHESQISTANNSVIKVDETDDGFMSFIDSRIGHLSNISPVLIQNQSQNSSAGRFRNSALEYVTSNEDYYNLRISSGQQLMKEIKEQMDYIEN